MPTVREQRLEIDYERLQQLVLQSGGRIAVEHAEGRPPDRYILRLRGRGVERLDDQQQPVLRDTHRIRVLLPARYPLDRPRIKMLTPIFHPHVWPTSEVCIGSDMLPGETIEVLIRRLLALVQFDPRYFDFSSVAHQKAATWAQQHLFLFPFEDTSGLPPALDLDPPPKPLFWRDAGPQVDWKDI